MKKFWVVFALIIGLASALGQGLQNAGAAATDTVAINATGVTIDIVETQTSFDFGQMAANDTSETTGGIGTGYFEVTNNTSVAVDITVGCTDLTGAPVSWTMSDDVDNGDGECVLLAGLEGTSFNIVVKKTGPFNDLDTGVAASGVVDWAAQLEAPSATVGNNAVSGTLTLTGSLP